MFGLSEHFTRVFLLAINGVFIGIGVSMLGSGIYQMNNTSNSLNMDIDDNESDGTTAIVAGCLDIIIGTLGMVGAYLRKRLLLWINVALLASSILGNVIILILYSIGTSRISDIAKANVKNIILHHYGNNTDEDSKSYTLAIDEHHKEDGCCGWSGIDGENLFLKSTWYKEMNMNATTNLRTLPDSCCLKTGVQCYGTNDVKDSRNQGYVQPFDCVDRIIGRVKTFMILTILQLVFVTLMQTVCVIFSLLHLLQNGVGS